MTNESLNVQNAMVFYGEINVEKDGNPSFVSRTKLRLSSHDRLSLVLHNS
jgi:hypothetical protein